MKYLAIACVASLGFLLGASERRQTLADPRVQWLARNAVRIRTVDPRDDNFQDLEDLLGKIGDARVVMLGEAAHGDGTTMLAKARIAKFLHQRMGFNVLVFESPLYDMSRAWLRIAEGEDPASVLPGTLFPVWERSPQVSELLKYVGRQAKSPRPFVLAGFDLQPGRRTRDQLLEELDSAARKFEVTCELTTHDSDVRKLAEQVRSNAFRPGGLAAPDPPTREAFYRGVEECRRRFAAVTKPDNRQNIEFWRQILQSSLRSYAEAVWFSREQGFDDPEWVGFNLRDRQNAENLLWLANSRHRGEKLIVWGASIHLIRRASTIQATIDPRSPNREYTRTVPTGDIVWRALGWQVYSIGFTAYQGVTGIGAADDPQGYHTRIKEDQDPSLELEELLHLARFDFAMVDLRRPASGGDWLRAPIVSRAIANQAMRAVWPDVLDAVFFIRNMEPNLATQPRTPSSPKPP